VNILFIINDAPYGTEKAYNALRLGMTLQKEHPGVEVWIFLMADAVGCALPGQSTPNGYYNLEKMLKSLLNQGAQVKVCGSCVDARGIRPLPLIAGCQFSKMSELAQWTIEADKVLTF